MKSLLQFKNPNDDIRTELEFFKEEVPADLTLMYHFDRFGRGCDMGQGGRVSGAGQWLCDIGWLKISAKFNI